MKKVLSLVLAMLMFAAALPAARAAEVIGSGACGENLTWVLDSDGTLTISGAGAMDEYYPEEEEPGAWHPTMPWNLYREKILSVVIENGVTDVYFGGTEEEWKAIEERSGSLGLAEEVRVHYNSEIKEKADE